MSERKFFVFKSIFEFEDGCVFENFTSFFQIHDNNELLWHCCRHYWKYIMNTEGGTSNKQFKFIFDLFTNGCVQLNKEMCNELRLNFDNKCGIEEPEKYPFKVEICSYNVN